MTNEAKTTEATETKPATAQATPKKPEKTAEQKATEKADKALAEAKKNASKHAHAKVETLRWDAEAGKMRVEIVCVSCGAVRSVFSSDLFQVCRCEACTKANRKAKKAEKKAEAKKATEAEQTF